MHIDRNIFSTPDKISRAPVQKDKHLIWGCSFIYFKVVETFGQFLGGFWARPLSSLRQVWLWKFARNQWSILALVLRSNYSEISPLSPPINFGSNLGTAGHSHMGSSFGSSRNGPEFQTFSVGGFGFLCEWQTNKIPSKSLVTYVCKDENLKIYN